MTARRHLNDTDEQGRPKASWWRVLIITAAALPLSWFAGSQAAGLALAKFNPEIATRAAPNNGEALARLAEMRAVLAIQKTDGELPSDQASPLLREAKKSFLRAPLSTRAIRIAAMASEAKGNTQLARKLMRTAVMLNKRDLATHLWLISDYGKSGDLESLLRHYDLALRTSSRAPDILLPRLALVLQVPEAIDVLTSILEQQPSWAHQFWRTTYTTPGTLPQAAKLRLTLLERGISVPDDADRRLILSLARDREWDAAADLYGRVAGDDAPRIDLIGEADFSRVPKLSPIEWSFPSSGLQSGEIVPETGRLLLSGAGGSSGIAAMRVVALKPGRYELYLDRAKTAGENNPKLTAEVACVEESPRRRLARFREEEGGIRGFFEVDASCRYYGLQIHLQVPRNSLSGQVVVEGIALHPA